MHNVSSAVSKFFSATTIVALVLFSAPIAAIPQVALAHNVGSTLGFGGVPISDSAIQLSWNSTSDRTSPSINAHDLRISFCSGASCTPTTIIYNNDSPPGSFLDSDPALASGTVDNGVFVHTGLTAGSYKYLIREKHGGSASETLEESVVVVIPPSNKGGLLVKKVLINDNGGTAATTSFSFTIPGVNAGNAIAFEADAQNDFSLAAGNYTVTEVVSTQYTTTYSGCTASVAVGATTTCTITNNDIAPSLTLNKVLVRNNGGSASESDWTLSATGPSTISGPGAVGTPDVVSGPTFKAGTYTLAETGGPAGYSASAWSCTNGVVVNGSSQITLLPGQTTVCSITNDDIGPRLTVTKIVESTHGGTKVVADFTLFVDLLQVFSGVQNTLNTGSYIVSEQSTAGYTGVFSGDCAANGSVTMALGDTKTCTITNTDIAPSLRLVKVVSGGPNFAPDWTLFASGPTPISGTTPVQSGPSFTAGTYTLSEVPGGAVVPYYVASPWSCSGGGTQVGATIALSVGQSAVCTITNTFTPPQCDDNADNDGDGLTDIADPGCHSDLNPENIESYTPTATSESDESTLALCTNEGDDDGDGLVNLEDPDCAAYIPKVTVHKTLINDSNTEGMSAITDFSFNVGGDPVFFDEDGAVTVSLPVGEYSVSETEAPGYTTTYSEGCTGSISAGQTKDCTITNDDMPTQIVVKKVVVNDSGKSAIASAFSFWLSIDDETSYTFAEGGENTLSVVPGVYTVTENTAPGYTTTYDACSGIELGFGQTATCTITNNDVPACSDSLDNDNDDSTDANDPGCHSDKNVENESSYTPDGQSEGNESTQALCTDGIDNDGDSLIDLADPDCAAFVPPTPPTPPAPPSGGGGGGNGNPFMFGAGGGAVLGASTGQVLGETCGLYLNKHLRLGSPKNDKDQASRLQTFLNKYMSANLPVTGFYGPMTASAVRAFQTKHADDILKPWGQTQPTGLVYLTTLRKINLVECPDLGLQLPALVPWSQNPAAQ